jgi:hypothetical protein
MKVNEILPNLFLHKRNKRLNFDIYYGSSVGESPTIKTL